jgi:hypothetical protein
MCAPPSESRVAPVGSIKLREAAVPALLGHEAGLDAFKFIDRLLVNVTVSISGVFTQCSVILYSGLSTGQPLCLGGPVASVAVRHVGIGVYLLLGLGVRLFYLSCQSWPAYAAAQWHLWHCLPFSSFPQSTIVCGWIVCFLMSHSLAISVLHTLLHQSVDSCLPLCLDAPAVSLFLCFTVFLTVLHQPASPSCQYRCSYSLAISVLHSVIHCTSPVCESFLVSTGAPSVLLFLCFTVSLTVPHQSVCESCIVKFEFSFLLWSVWMNALWGGGKPPGNDTGAWWRRLALA